MASKPVPPCLVCGAPSSRRVGLSYACDECADALHRAALAKRDALMEAIRRLAADGQTMTEDAA